MGNICCQKQGESSYYSKIKKSRTTQIADNMRKNITNSDDMMFKEKYIEIQ